MKFVESATGTNVLVERGFTITLLLFLVGCAGKPIIQTQVIDRPVPITCEVKIPDECKDSYAMDKVSVKDDMLRINRALRAEIEERTACEVMLRSVVKGCNGK